MSQWDSKSFHDAVVSRDKACQHCGGSELLQAHHIVPCADNGEDDPANGICLCAGCHADEHPDVPRNFFFIKAWGPYNPGGWSATYVAGLLNCHPRTIVRRARTAGIKREGQYWAFTEDDLAELAYLERATGKEKFKTWDELPKYLGADQVSDFLQLHVNTVKGWCRSGKLQAKKIGKSWRIPKNSLRAVLGEEDCLTSSIY